MRFRRRIHSRAKSVVAMMALLICVGAVTVATSRVRPSGPPSWYLEHLTRNIERDPSPLAFTARANYLAGLKQIDHAIADVREAIRRNPGDLGQTYKPSNGRELSAEALRHGEQQLKRMLKDRPQMARHVRHDDELYTWTIRKFAGEDIGVPIHWNNSDPWPATADNGHFGDRAQVRVQPARSGEFTSSMEAFDALWGRAVFELHNLIASPRFAALYQQAAAGSIERSSYILSMCKLEEQATERTRAFYLDFYAPWARSRKLTTYPERWFVYHFIIDDAHRTQLWQGTHYWNYYGVGFDLHQIDRHIAQGRLAEAERSLNSMQDQIETLGPVIASGWHRAKGELRTAQGNHDEAVKELEAAIRARPEVARNYCLQGLALAKLGRFDEALQLLAQYLSVPGLNPPERAYGFVCRAYVHECQKNPTAALAELSKALEANREHVEAYERRSALHHELGDFDAAWADLTELLRIDSQNAWAHHARAHLFISRGEYQDALVDLNTALQLAPDDAAMYASRGWAFANLEQFQLAADDFIQALKLDPDSADAVAGRGFLMLQWKAYPERDLERAQQDLLHACEEYAWQHPDYVEILADICQERGDKKLADEYRQKAEQLSRPAAEQSTEPSLPSSSDGAGRTQTPLAISC